ncbi:glycoside hydrolase family 3 C-terminal domain-containing protein [Bythopirellula polymerisocia]|uniref:Periplasmic beta-glucosidase n=1 Tax=Bythopirellula polymerisocia TaxID=2528003 RepID=A0A5C6C7X3_9BACT|nr:glycoside hydrolase family 3 C-terminal domain-containing protein [Bythopirellula polymerisocia]TWU20753.1 Periplasmic beta-glucosidase precursor [Bythopirellula polymerisocia]
MLRTILNSCCVLYFVVIGTVSAEDAGILFDADGQPLASVSHQPQAGTIYHEGWIDLNKNGIKDPYENTQLDVEKRIDDLLPRMNIDEKTCQLATLYGYGRVLSDQLPQPSWKNEIWKDGIGNIDEHLNCFDGWGKPPHDHQWRWPASRHAWAMNNTQQWFIEETRLGIPVDFTNEGIRGIETYKATNFPTQLGIGHTWNRALVRLIGEITGQEARLLGYTNVYAPILDVGRDQRWGRMEEVYGESPYLVAELGIQMTRGLQSQGVASTAKHFCIYSENKGGREGLARCDPRVPWREAELLHLYPFARVIREAKIMGVMSSYNDYDGVPISGSSEYLTDKLRKEYGFGGYVVSDSDAVKYLFSKHHVAADYKEAVGQFILTGGNVRTTFNHPDNFILPLRELVDEGQVPSEVIDSRVRDVLRVKYQLGLFDHPYMEDYERADEIVYCAAHRKVALQASRESLVLLKNEKHQLPLDRKKIKVIAVCGPNADDPIYALTHYGPVGVPVVTVLDGIREKVGDSGKVLYAKGCDIIDENWPDSEILPTPLTDTETSLIKEAVSNAKQADVAVVVVGGNWLTCGENKSRTSLDLPGRQRELIQAVHATGTPVVAVLISGRPLSINWTDRHVPAILAAWYPGSEGGTAISEVLFGDYNPGGKLTVTFPKTVGQIPMNFPAKPNSQIDAWKQRARVNGVLYPFGHGMSYTTFAYSDLTITPQKTIPSNPVTITCEITNTGKQAGDEVVQLYTRDLVSTVTTYEKNLRGFERVHLGPGESKVVEFTIDPQRDLCLLNRKMQRVVETGEFKIMIGASSEDIRLAGTLRMSKE